MKAHGFTLCRCKDCTAEYDGERLESYTDDRGLHHFNDCNHITEVDFDKIEDEMEVWDSEYQVDYWTTVTIWSGYRCTCETIVSED